MRTINSSQRDTISETVHQLRKNHYHSPLFLAVHAETGIPLITLLKDENIPCTLIGPDSLASDQFRQGFDKEQKETKIPGFYTRDVVVSSPFILDTASNEAQMFNSLYIKNYHQPA